MIKNVLLNYCVDPRVMGWKRPCVYPDEEAECVLSVGTPSGVYVWLN